MVRIVVELSCIAAWVIAYTVEWTPKSRFKSKDAVTTVSMLLAILSVTAALAGLACYGHSAAKAAGADHIW